MYARLSVLLVIIGTLEALILPCEFYESKEYTERPTCCVVASPSADAEKTFYCTPRFIIIGTQKSGTTALAGLLSRHPRVKFSSGKEVHFFDKNTSALTGSPAPLTLLPYMKHFSVSESAAAQAVSESPPPAGIEGKSLYPDVVSGDGIDAADPVSSGVAPEEGSLATTLTLAEATADVSVKNSAEGGSADEKPRRRRRRRAGLVPVENSHVEQLFFGDATPFYLASRLSCKRISDMFPANAARPVERTSARDDLDNPTGRVVLGAEGVEQRSVGGAADTGASPPPASASASASTGAPSMKFVVLLRDPVERLYSEFHMKHRRVQEQTAFLNALNAFGAEVQHCLRMVESKHLYSQRFDPPPVSAGGSCPSLSPEPIVPRFGKNREFLECLPLPMTRNSGFPLTRFLQQLDKLYAYKASAPTTQEAASEETAAEGGGAQSRCPSRYDRRQFAFAALSALPPSEYCFDATPEDPSLLGAAPAAASMAKPAVAAVDEEAEALRAEMARLGIEAGGPAGRPAPPAFLQRLRCNMKFGNEHVGASIETVLQDELDALVSCGGDDILRGNISAVDAVVSRCVRVRKGIADQYLFRSMYAAQLHHCWKSLDRRAFLILRAEDLKNRQQETLDRVLQFLEVERPRAAAGLSGEKVVVGAGVGSSPASDSVAICMKGHCPDAADLAAAVDAALGLAPRAAAPSQVLAAPVPEKEAAADLEAEIARAFPEFAATSGWKLHSSYPPLPDALRTHLHDALFRHHEQLLEELLA